MNQPLRDSQSGRILGLLESAHRCGHPYECEDPSCGRVPLPSILNLRISQYSARIHDLRHRFGFVIENGAEEGDSSHTWFRLEGRRLPTQDTLEDKSIQHALHAELEKPVSSHPNVNGFLFDLGGGAHRDLG
jgi:hypothetical protein